MSFNSGTPTSESPMCLGQPDHTSGLTGQDGGQPDHAHSQDITDTRPAIGTNMIPLMVDPTAILNLTRTLATRWP